MSKLGMNIVGIHFKPRKTWVRDYGCGIWSPELDHPNVLIAGRLKEVGVKWLRYPGGLNNRHFTLGLALNGKFKLDNFIQCCRAIKATPVITVSVFLGVAEAVEIIKYVRETLDYTDEVWVEVGNEPWLGEDLDVRPHDYTPEEYIVFYTGLHTALEEDAALKWMTIIPSPRWYHINQIDWIGGIQTGLDESLYDAIAVHPYFPYADFDDNERVLDEVHALFPNTKLHITEWNMNNGTESAGPVGHGSHKHFTYCWKFLQLMERLDYVEAHYYWELGDYWKLFEHDGTPLAHWLAFELHAEE